MSRFDRIGIELIEKWVIIYIYIKSRIRPSILKWNVLIFEEALFNYQVWERIASLKQSLYSYDLKWAMLLKALCCHMGLFVIRLVTKGRFIATLFYKSRKFHLVALDQTILHSIFSIKKKFMITFGLLVANGMNRIMTQ